MDGPLDEIFVQIASFRDPECQWTIRDLYEKAAHPERVFVGVCWQYDEHEDQACFRIETRAGQVRVSAFPWQESRGVCWARHEARKLWQGEKYLLSIDSHMRFAQEWDERLIAELAACPSAKPVLTHYPPGYLPPNTLDPNPMPSILRANYFEDNGTMRARSVPLDMRPLSPLRGAFVAPGFLFAQSQLLKEVPPDPYLYFEQEELALSARFYTHGFDVYSPTDVFAYHYYNHAANGNSHLLHWTNCPSWSDLEIIASSRLNHLFGYAISEDPEIIAEIETYGLGNERTLDSFELFCGLSLKHRSVSNKSLRGGFIPDLALYKKGLIHVPELDSVAIKKSAMVHPESVLEFQSLLMPSIPTVEARVDRSAPPGVLLVHDFLDSDVCNMMRKYADRHPYKSGGVIDLVRRGTTSVIKEDRSASLIEIDGMVSEVLNLFNDIWCNRVAPYFDVKFEWYERPQLLRYPTGGKYVQHSDADEWMLEKNDWERVLDRDYSVVLYLNDDFEGGDFEFTRQNYTIRPKPGMLLAFPSGHQYLHAVLPTLSGIRYALVSWAAVAQSPRVAESPTYASVYLRQGTL